MYKLCYSIPIKSLKHVNVSHLIYIFFASWQLKKIQIWGFLPLLHIKMPKFIDPMTKPILGALNRKVNYAPFAGEVPCFEMIFVTKMKLLRFISTNILPGFISELFIAIIFFIFFISAARLLISISWILFRESKRTLATDWKNYGMGKPHQNTIL